MNKFSKLSLIVILAVLTMFISYSANASNQPPNCSGAAADPDSLWPPNHKFEEISIVGVTDPDGDPVTIIIGSLFQDEPTNGLGQGDTCPDGTGVGTDTADVRSERSGKGNGRVYTIGFTATDNSGDTCSGTAKVCVPHDDQASVCIEDGPPFDSTACD